MPVQRVHVSKGNNIAKYFTHQDALKKELKIDEIFKEKQVNRQRFFHSFHNSVGTGFGSGVNRNLPKCLGQITR